jgi:hypothetical protein
VLCCRNPTNMEPTKTWDVTRQWKGHESIEVEAICVSKNPRILIWYRYQQARALVSILRLVPVFSQEDDSERTCGFNRIVYFVQDKHSSILQLWALTAGYITGDIWQVPSPWPTAHGPTVNPSDWWPMFEEPMEREWGGWHWMTLARTKSTSH